MELSVYQKSEFLKARGYKVGIAEGTENYPHHVTKEGTQLNSSVNYAFNLETNNSDVLIITVSQKSHNKVILTNKNGDEFEFNPVTKNGENLFDFLFK